MIPDRYAPFITAVSSLILLFLAHSPLERSAKADPPGTAGPRELWTTSRITGTPDPPLPYITELAFPALKFNQCLDLTKAPGSNRLFLVEQSGKIFSFSNAPNVQRADLVVDLAKAIPGVKEVYALAFHPQFEQNQFCFVCYIKEPNLRDGTHIARFRMTNSDPPKIDVTSETTILTWLSGGHNGCCLKFGPDGYLYISTGDGAGPNPPDPLRAGQDVSNLLSAILRIDVDHADAGRNYRIPADNPLVGLEGARGEIWAYGFRNPWRMSFDARTGDLWVGDVGWELWELLDRVERGGNYGWSVMEGRQPTNPEWSRGPTPILPPTIDHPHSESSSITDGLTYYGERLKELHGHHIYGDYDTGKFWSFRFENGRVVDHREIADTTHRVVGFGEDAAGEFYVLDHTAGTIHRLVPNPRREQATPFPRKLSETGLFTSVTEVAPAPGVLPYAINAEPWADFAVADRFVAVPGDGRVQVQEGAWKFPKDSVLVKTLSLEVERSNPSSRRRIETQILHFDGTEWQPYSYRWSDDQSDASLLDASGAEQDFAIKDPQAPSGLTKQTWRFSGRAECQRCHNKWSGPPLAFNTPQLNRPVVPGAATSQLDDFAAHGLLERPVAAAPPARLANPRDETADRGDRARAYLHVNCSHCHRLHAGSSVLSKMHFDLPLEKTDMVGVRPTQGTFGIQHAQVIAPGDPFRSVLWYRMSKLGGGRMPHLGSTEVDREGVQLIFGWVRSLTPASGTDPTAADPKVVEAAAILRSKALASLAQLAVAANKPDQAKIAQELLASTNGAMLLLHAVDHQALPKDVSTLAIDNGTRHPDSSVRDLFERFLPAEKRVKRLGSVVRPDQILVLNGDAARGKSLFFQTEGITCKNCHRIDKVGGEVGPDLTTIGAKYDRAQLLESMLEPSKRIDPKYVTQVAETKSGELHVGILVQKTAEVIVLKDAQDKLHSIGTGLLQQLVPQPQSLMPELLLRDMTAQQVADLVAFLSSLK